MKKYLLLFIALLPFACFAQFSAGFGLGYDFKSSKALFTMNTAYELEHIKLEGELTPALSRSVDANNFMGFKIGYDIANFITPSVGYYYGLVSTDNKELNGYYVGYSVKVVHQLNDHGGLFFNAMLINKQCQLTAGLHCIF